MGMKERLTLIIGPPGTGKTLTITALAANLMKCLENPPKILICAPSNSAADYIAQRFQDIPLLAGKYLRIHSEKREDIYNIDFRDLKPYSPLYKLIYESNEYEHKEDEMRISGINRR